MDRDQKVRILSGNSHLRRVPLESPERIERMLEAHRRGWGLKRIAREFGVSRNTVRRYVRQGGWKPYATPKRARELDGLALWLEEMFKQHRGNAVVVHQELARVHGIDVSLRTVQRAVARHRREFEAAARATTRFETPPGRQAQVDFGEMRVVIGGVATRVHLGVVTLGYSRRVFAQAFRHQRQSAWFDTMEGAFRYFGGVPEEVLMDNARALVQTHNRATREVVFNPKLKAFADYWGFRPRACAPYRAQTKGKDERSVGYVKHNAIAGRAFDSFEALEQHLDWWMREVADRRVHGTTGQMPLRRFDREERCLRPIDGRPPFVQRRELQRKVHTDLCVVVDTNAYSVPWRLIGCMVTVQLVDGVVRVLHAGQEVARHARCVGRRQRRIDRRHFNGLHRRQAPSPAEVRATLAPSLAAYDALVGGGW